MAELGVIASVVQLTQVTQLVLTSCYRFLRKVKNAVEDVNQTIHEVGQLMALLADLAIVVKNKNDSEISHLKPLTGAHGPLTLALEALEKLDAKLSASIGAGQLTFREKLKWPFESKKVAEILNTIKKQRGLIELTLAGDTNAMIREIKLSLEETKMQEERERVLNWLRTGDPTARHLQSRNRYQSGSNLWVLESVPFKSWRDSGGSTFWIHGIPGAGKTILCSTIIDHLTEIVKNGNGVRMAYFYFSFNDSNTQALEHVLRSLITQLSEYSVKLSSELRQLYEESDNGRKQPDGKALTSIFLNILNEGPKTFLIIDALDECSLQGRSQLCNFIMEDMKKPSARNYNILFTSRKELDIEQSMARIAEVTNCYVFPIIAKDINNDICLYVNQFLDNQDNGTFRNLPLDIRTEIQERMVTGALGMFRWVACQLDAIRKCKQTGAIRRLLKSLPSTLEETYDRILLSIPEETWEIAKSALILLTYSIRPLTIRELAEGMVVDTSDQRFDAEEHRLIYYREVLDICSSLVTVSTVEHNENDLKWLREKVDIERRSFRSEENHDVELVQLAHFSVKEYLISEKPKGTEAGQISRFRFSNKIAHRCIAQMSLVYLLDFSKGARLPEINFQSFPFLAYASRFWPEHWKLGIEEKGEDDRSTDTLLKRLFNTEQPNPYINTLDICNPDLLLDPEFPGHINFGLRKTGKSLDSFPPPIYYTAQMGNDKLCEWLLDMKGYNINQCQGRFGTPLQVAARLGHENVVRFLISRDADVNTYGGEYGTAGCRLWGPRENWGKFGSALIAACQENHLPVAKILLEQGADSDIFCSRQRRGKALNVAAGTGNTQLVQLLLKHGANIDDTCGGEGTALYTAAGAGALATVRMLLRAGAGVNLESGDKCTALHNACARDVADVGERNHIEMVRLLLGSGANVKIRGGHYGDVVQAAVEGGAEGNGGPGYIGTLNLLLQYGADIHYMGGVYKSALNAAVFCGNSEAARLLIGLGAEINDEIFVNAIESKRKQIIPLLIARGVNINAAGKEGTALQVAISTKDNDTIELLLDNPLLDVNAQGGGCGETALYHAVKKDDTKLVELLLAKGADANQECGDGTRCLNRAARSGNLEMARLLIEHGASIDGQTAQEATALVDACDSGKDDMVQFLLDQNADVNVWSPKFGDALQVAAYRGRREIVNTLLKKGANVITQEGEHGSCLEAAIMGFEDEDIPHLLVDAGANINFSRPNEDINVESCGVGGPLLASIWKKQQNLASFLIDKGADINFPGRDYYGTPLEQSIYHRCAEVVDILLSKGADVNQIGGDDGCALGYAINGETDDTGYPVYLQRILDAGADVNLSCGTYGSPLAVAVRRGNVKVVETLLDYGANIDVPAGRYGSPFQIAIKEGDLEVFKLLLERGANVNFECNKGQLNLHATPLSVALMHSNTMFKELLDNGAHVLAGESICLVRAAAKGDTKEISKLLDLGANVRCQQGIPGRALQMASRGAHIEACQILLNHGADINAFGGNYGNALMAAIDGWMENGILPMGKFLLEQGASVNPPPCETGTSALLLAIRKGYSELVDLILEKDLGVNAHDQRWGTALIAAARRESGIGVLEQLLARGANVNLSGQEYGTALQLAAKNGNTKVIGFLLDHGAEVNQISCRAGTALAAACGDDRAKPIIQLLLNHGADINLRGGKYETALQYAAKKGHLQVVNYLLEQGADPTIEGGKYKTATLAAEAKKKYWVVGFLRGYLKRKLSKTKA
ncbi:hypothetical protein H072_6587 [Dactylellina haptotyla CBS 200.50]|uniref:Nephrocystin 3-like N-terminal domain-containing protein n=1 Tax=Dactylellina haptotyla (strain CBS 200.50) TaxID=1284197 RepID=S8BWC4_DACHA|nr:hypothetical protein H072_6587 [Dactylellina haptotyla CBS 200.50]